MNTSQALIITGMHRSHTSLVAEGFQKAGLFLGEDLIGAMPSNPHGHFESKVIVDFHSALIKKHSLRSWWRFVKKSEANQVALSGGFVEEADKLIKDHFRKRLFGWKDPRAAFFLKGWHKVLPQARFVFVVRHPSSCVYSLNKRSLKHTRIKYRPYLTTRHFNLWDDTNKCIIEFVKEFPDQCLIIHAPDHLINIEKVNNLNIVIREQWRIDLPPLDYTDIYDPTLVKSKDHPLLINRLYNSRRETKMLYEELVNLCT